MGKPWWSWKHCKARARVDDWQTGRWAETWIWLPALCKGVGQGDLWGRGTWLTFCVLLRGWWRREWGHRCSQMSREAVADAWDRQITSEIPLGWHPISACIALEPLLSSTFWARMASPASGLDTWFSVESCPTQQIQCSLRLPQCLLFSWQPVLPCFFCPSPWMIYGFFPLVSWSPGAVVGRGGPIKTILVPSHLPLLSLQRKLQD